MSSKPIQNILPLLVRYQLFCDDASGALEDEHRVAELVCSLASLKLYLEPYTPIHVYVYTLARFVSRLTEAVAAFGFSAYTVLDISSEEDEAYAETIRNCSPVDRFCIRRMLSDFSRLPNDHFRLLLGTDIYFYRPPQELIQFLQEARTGSVLYMVDNFSFGDKMYGLTYHPGPMLKGLLGDYYCLSQSVALSSETIRKCLNTIDAWEPKHRWDPHPTGIPDDYVHACEQQAAAILLSGFEGKQLPTTTYHHLPRISMASPALIQSTVVHCHFPWTLIREKAIPELLARETLRFWKQLGMNTTIKQSRRRSAAYLKARRLVYRLFSKK